jgi:CRISPR-associated protein Csd1
MGLWQLLADSYDANADALRLTYPLSTTSISNNGDIIAIIVIDGNGDFVRFDKIEKANHKKGINTEYVTIPVTEESMGRSSGISPHPVFDQYEYLKGDGRKYDDYIAQLRKFSESAVATDQVKAIYKYVAKRTIAADLAGMNLKDKTNIVFEVEISGNSQTKVWQDETLFNAWHQHYLAIKESKKGSRSVDYISGLVQPLAKAHPKKISNASANAKLVSDNDKTNYSFRGKFSESSEAVSIGYETTQKAHQYLRYLINDRGYYCGEQVILSFAIGSLEKLLPPPVEDKCIWDMLQDSQVQTKSDTQIALRAETGFDYSDALRKSLAGYGYGSALNQHAKTVVIALDAATTGRLSITFYRQLDLTEYIEKIAGWHYGCKWNQRYWDNNKKTHVSSIGAPSIDKIIEAVYGKPRGGTDQSYIKIKKAARERLLRCVFDDALLPWDYVAAAIRRASNPLGVAKDGKFDRNGFEQTVSTACAMVRKHYHQSKKEDYTLSIELDRTDRDYLYGRLLGAADKLEEYALFKKENERVVTAAIRHMQAFTQRPFRTWQTIHSCLNPYVQMVKGSFAFNEIQAVMGQFLPGDYEKETPLTGSYLIGYYHERAYIDSLVRNAGNNKLSSSHNEKESNNDGQ